MDGLPLDILFPRVISAMGQDMGKLAILGNGHQSIHRDTIVPVVRIPIVDIVGSIESITISDIFRLLACFNHSTNMFAKQLTVRIN